MKRTGPSDFPQLRVGEHVAVHRPAHAGRPDQSVPGVVTKRGTRWVTVKLDRSRAEYRFDRWTGVEERGDYIGARRLHTAAILRYTWRRDDVMRRLAAAGINVLWPGTYTLAQLEAVADIVEGS